MSREFIVIDDGTSMEIEKADMEQIYVVMTPDWRKKFIIQHIISERDVT